VAAVSKFKFKYLRHEVVDEDAEVFVLVQNVHPVVVFDINQLQMLVGVGQNVQNERRRILQVHLGVLAQFHHLVHQLPRLFDRFPVDDRSRRRDGVRDRAVHSAEETFRLPRSFRTTNPTRRHLYRRANHTAQHVKCQPTNKTFIRK